MLNANVINEITTDGITNKYGYEVIFTNPSNTKFPNEACGIGTPSPMKLKNASVKIIFGISVVSLIIITLNVFGIKCFKVIHKKFPPSDFEANTNSFSLIFKTSPRTSSE